MYKKKLTEEEKRFQAKLMLEKELISLSRQYEVLDRACTHSQFARGNSLLKGDKVLAIFQKEYVNIVTDLTRAAAPGRIRDDEKDFDELAGLLEENKFYSYKVHQHKVYIQELDVEIKLVQKQVQLLRKQQITDRQYEDRIWHAIKIIEALENKLETQMIQFGTICTKNQLLRDEIDHLLWQRRIFMNQWQRLIEKLSEGKKIMLDLIEQATIAYNQREEWCNKLQLLRLRAHHDLLINIQEMREEKRKYDQNEKLRDFFLIKGQKRLMLDLEEKEKEKQLQMHKVLEEKINRFRNMLDDIQNFSRESNLKNIASKFAKQEELNLSKFKFVMEMIWQMEAINERLGNLYLEIDDKCALHESREHQQKTKLEQLTYNLEDIQNSAAESENQLKETESIFQSLIQGVSTLFKICKCDKDPLLRLLGDNNTVHFYNVELYLEVLERTIHEILITAGYKDRTKKSGDKKQLLDNKPYHPRVFGIDKIVTITPCSLCVEHEMVSDVIDVLQRVWSREEAKDKLQFRLQLPGGKARLHTISHCHLPKARRLMQRRYE